MPQVSKPSLLWGILGIIILIVVFNKWMSSQIEPPDEASHPIEVITEPAKEPTAAAAPKLPSQAVQEETAAPANAQAAAEGNEPKVGEKVLEPIYEAPKNDVILVN